MSAYLFSMLPDNALIDWDAEADLLRFDEPAISAAHLQIRTSADGRSVVIEDAAGKTVTLQGVSLFELSASHLVFADGSRLVLPTIDNSFGFNLAGSSGNDLLLGAAPARPLIGAATNSAGAVTNGSAAFASLSGDGRLVAFASSGSNLVDSDANNTTDIFVKDVATGQTTRVSTSSTGVEANASSQDPTISMNGRFVVFQSLASNLVAGDSNAQADIFIKDLLNGATTRVSTDSTGAQADQQSRDASIAGNGRFVVFTSGATNLVAGDTNARDDIFVKDLQTGSTRIVSGSGTADDQSRNAAISADGRVIAFNSFATNLVFGDTNAVSDVFVRNTTGGTLQRVSTDASGVQANGHSQNASLSADGRYVAFDSRATNLVASDSNGGTTDVFVKDRVSGAVTLVSQRADGTQGNSFSGNATISGDGRYVAFYSEATNLVDGDTNGWYDVFVKDLQTGALQRLSVGPDGNQGVATSFTSSLRPEFSADGSTITFTSPSRALLPGDPTNAITVYTVSNPLLGVTLAGGSGNDVYEIQRATDAVVEDAGGGTDTVRASVSYALTANVEHLTLTGSEHINATGNSGNNVLTGNAGDNVLDGGAGTDTASYASSTSSVSVALDLEGLAQDTGGAGVDTLIGIENLTGSAFDDFLVGNDGANVLDGGLGADVLVGGLGNDRYVLNVAQDEVFEDVNGGTDTVVTSFSYTLGANLENLILSGSGNFNATGNALDNVLTGNNGSNRLNGGTGVDTASYATSRVGVTVGLDRVGPQSTGAGIDTLISIENLTGSNRNDVLHGNANANVLNGGAGIDTLSYARAASAVAVSLAITTAQATGGGGSDTVLNFENLTGSAFADTLTGNTGSNVLDGGLGADTLTGGAGNDSYYVDNAGDSVVELAAEGLDTVYSTINHMLALNVENLILLGSTNINGTGNAGNNVLTGNSGANLLNGGSGSDTASYAAASGAVTANLATGAALGGGGNDTLISIENLIGSAFGDTLIGSATANVLNGGAGADTLTGGAGADAFVLDSRDSIDTVTDFVSSADKIRISQSGISVGNGNLVVDGAQSVTGPSGFSVGAELVIVSNNATSLSLSGASAAIGVATSNYVVGDQRLFVVDNGVDTAIFHFTASNADAQVGAGELQQIATLIGISSTALGDFVFVA